MNRPRIAHAASASLVTFAAAGARAQTVSTPGGDQQHPPAPAVPASATSTPASAVVMAVVAGSGVAGFADGVGAAAQFNKPIRLAPFGPDAVLVADIFNHAIRVVSKDGRVRTIVGAPDRKGHEDGPASTARLASPHGVASLADGRLVVAEAEGHALRVLTPRPDAPGTYEVSTLAGWGLPISTTTASPPCPSRGSGHRAAAACPGPSVAPRRVACPVFAGGTFSCSGPSCVLMARPLGDGSAQKEYRDGRGHLREDWRHQG